LEFKRLLHPQAIIPVKLNKKVVTEKIITNILAYVVIFSGICLISIIIFMLFGNEFTESAGMAISCLSNVGPGLASQTNGIFALQDDFIKWFMGLLMLIGRLEIFTVLFILTPVFWKKS
jgi:trk system potassium uptake protein TrkH